MDPAAGLVRNPEVSSQAPLHPTSLLDPSPSPGVLVDVVVLSADARLFEAIRSSIGERNPVWRARSAEESVELLMTGRCGVLVVDMAAVSTDPAALIEQIVAQFPDVVVVVAGRREDEPLLARLVSDGHVYRFMHKPLSAKRAGMFLRASIRHHVDRRELRLPGLRLTEAAQRTAQAVPTKWLFVASGVGVFVALLSVVFGRLGHDESQRPSVASGSAVATSPQATAVPRADPVLSRARAALAGGRYESPVGRNALDLYAAVLLASPGHAEAQAGLADTVDKIVAMADQASADGDVDEARRLLERLQAVTPQGDAVAALARRLEPPRPAIEPPATPLPTDPVSAPNSIARVTPTAPPTLAVAPTPTATPLPVSVPRPVATRAPTVTVPALPPLATVPPRPVAAAPASPRRSSAVTPDPLTPRIVNADELRPLRASWRTGRPSDPGLPAAPSLPTAGYEKPTAAVQAPPMPAEPVATVATVDGTPVPIDDFQPLSVVDPVYPPQALRNGIEGWVELEFTVTETGVVRDVAAIRAEPRGVFESAAAEALAKWRFVPRTAFGRPVSQRSTVTLRFNVDG